MCNEFRFRQSIDAIAELFSRLQIPLRWEGGAPNLEPRDSIRPTDPAPVAVGEPGGAELRQLRWGFARDKGGPLINFRSEGRSFRNGRALVLCDGFYEYTGDKAPKAKWLFAPPAEGELMALGGLVRDDRFTLLTMEPGPDVAPYHARQVVVVPQDQWAGWLAPGVDAPMPALPAGSLAVSRLR